MEAAIRLGLDKKSPIASRDFRTQARSGNASADDYNIEVHGAGYELESPSV